MVQTSLPARIGLVLAALFALLLATIGSGPVAAVGFTVNTTVDAVDAVPGDGSCATAAANCSLRAAIQEANALSGPDSISVPAGAYALSVADGDGSVDLDVTASITLNGAGAGSTVFDGGGLDRVVDVQSSEAVFISNITVRNGNATSASGDGGGIRNVGGQLHLSSLAIEDNDAPDALIGGGGLYNTLGTVTIADSTVSGNTAAGASAGGGGIANEAGTVALTNVTLSGNSAPMGGAIYNTDSAAIEGSVTGNNVTIAANTSANGALFTEGGSVTIRNTIVGTNTGTNCATGAGGTFFSTGHNISSDNSCPATAEGDLASTDPQLGPLADNGGSTQTHALMPASPAIDAGDDTGCSGTDQRGIDRPQGAHCDIGAFELEQQLVQGDIDCSEAVDSVDALKVLRFSAGLSIAQTEPCPDPPSVVAAFPFSDVDCNGAVNSVDALKILRSAAGLGVTQMDPCTDIGLPL